MLQEKWLTGLFFLAGILANSWLMLLGGLLASAVGLATSLGLRFNKGEIDVGYYGFNSALVGICIFFYLPISAISIGLLVGCAVLSTLLMRGMLWFRWLPPYTAPFVVSGWVALFGAHVFGLSNNALPGVTTDMSIPVAISQGIGQVMFQGNTLSGVLFIVGLAVSLPLIAVWAVAGSALGLLTAVLMDLPIGMTAIGIYGFNSVLAAIALSAEFRKSITLPLLGVVIAVIITRGFQLMGVPPLTAPFVLTAWLIIFAYKFIGMSYESR